MLFLQLIRDALKELPNQMVQCYARDVDPLGVKASTRACKASKTACRFSFTTAPRRPKDVSSIDVSSFGSSRDHHIKFSPQASPAQVKVWVGPRLKCSR